MTADGGTAPPGWHPDPHGRATHRWWDGNGWTSHVSNNGQAYDEAAAGPQTPAAPVGGDLDAALQALAGHRFLSYQEREHGTYGGRIDIVGTDGRPVAVAEAEADKKSNAYGFMAEDVPVHLTDLHGLRLATLVRKPGTLREDHPVLDPNGVMMGEFIGPLGFNAEVKVQCGAGMAARMKLGHKESWLTAASGQPLARVIHAEGFKAVEFNFLPVGTPDSFFRNDSFVLEVVAPMPPWLFVFALLAPVEANMREDNLRRQI